MYLHARYIYMYICASMPETGEAVVATLMIECVRDMSYDSWPSHSGSRQKSCTALPRW